MWWGWPVEVVTGADEGADKYGLDCLLLAAGMFIIWTWIDCQTSILFRCCKRYTLFTRKKLSILTWNLQISCWSVANSSWLILVLQMRSPMTQQIFSETIMYVFYSFRIDPLIGHPFIGGQCKLHESRNNRAAWGHASPQSWSSLWCLVTGLHPVSNDIRLSPIPPLGNVA